MRFIGTTMEMFRGDSETLTVLARDKATKAPIALVTGDTVKLTVRRNEDDEISFQEVVTTFVDGKALIPILPTDTSGLARGRYVYDIEVTFASGEVKTPVKGVFKLEGDVTYGE